VGDRVTGLARRHPDAVAVVALSLLPFAIFAHALWPGRVLSPADILMTFPPWASLAPGTLAANPLQSDVAFMFDPWLIYAGRAVAAGQFPLWNPYAFTGAPFFANPQTALLFPLTWLAYVLPATIAITLIMILKLSVAGVGTYVFARLLGARPVASVIGAVSFMLNGALVMWLGWAVGSAMAMLPWLFAATEWLRQRGSRRAIAAVALAVAVSIFAGSPQITAVALLAAGAFTLVRAPATERPWFFLVAWASGALIGCALAAVQILPFLEYLGESSVYAYRSQWMPVMAAPPRSALALLMPGYFGSATGRDYWGYFNENEIAATVGLVPWVALPAAIVAGWRAAATRFFLGLAGVAAVLCYDTPGVTDWLGALPPFSFVITFRMIVFFAFALSVLTALGLEALATAVSEARRRMDRAIRISVAALAAVTCLLVIQDYPIFVRAGLVSAVAAQYVLFVVLLGVAALASLAPAGSRATWLLLAVQVAVLAPTAATENPVIASSLFYPEPPALTHLRARSDPHERVVLGVGKNLGMLYGLREVAGYDGLTPHRVEHVAGPRRESWLLASGSIDVTIDAASPLFDLLAIRRVVVPRDTATVPAHIVPDYQGRDARIVSNTRALPRAFLAARARCASDQEALRLIRGAEVDLRQEVVLSGCQTPPPGVAELGVARVVFAIDDAERVRLTTESDGPAWLVLSDTWFPGWQARVDDVPQPVRRADYAFRAVALDAGRHDVEIIYAPRSVRDGLVITLVAAGIVGALLIPGRRGMRSRLTPMLMATIAVLAAMTPALAGSLPEAPLSVAVPTTLHEGHDATVTFEASDSLRGGVPFDVYVIRIPSRQPVRRYLSSTGIWTLEPTPWLRYRSATTPTSQPATWREEGPAGFITLVVVFVRAGGSPGDRSEWLFRPVLGRVSVRPAATTGSGLFASALGVVTLATCALVLFGMPAGFATARVRRPASG